MTETEAKLVEALKLAIYTLNEHPSFGVRRDDFKTSYAVVKHLEQVLSSIPQEGQK